jgi:hypothetical protein
LEKKINITLNWILILEIIALINKITINIIKERENMKAKNIKILNYFKRIITLINKWNIIKTYINKGIIKIRVIMILNKQQT